MTKSTITRERIQRIIRAIDSESYDEEEIREWLTSDEIMGLARMALAAMDSESGCLPLDYLQGHKDGLEWAAQLAEANHPETGEWLYDDPIELAKAIRKGPDMQPVQPVADSEPVIVVGDDGGDALSYRRLIQSFEPGTKLYRHAQPEPAVSAELLHTAASAIEDLLTTNDRTGACVWFDLPFRLRSAANAQQPVVPDVMEPTIEAIKRILPTSNPDEYAACIGADMWNACRAAMLAAAPQSPGSDPATVPGKWIPVSERMPEDRTQVILWDAEIGEVTSGHYSHKTQTFYHCGDAIENEITHWMLPPSAPQGVKP